jgi:hypothetical protein
VLFGLATKIVDAFCRYMQKVPKALCCCTYGTHLYEVTAKYTEAAFDRVHIDTRDHWRKSRLGGDGGEIVKDDGGGGGGGGGRGDNSGRGEDVVGIEVQDMSAPTKGGEGGSRGGTRRAADICMTFKSTGGCEFGDKCKFSHEAVGAAAGGVQGGRRTDVINPLGN